MRLENFATRHSIKKKREDRGSENYPGLSPEGVELGIKTTKEMLKSFIDSLPRNAIIAILGVSDAVRTRSTSQIYGDTLKKLYEGDNQVVVKTEEEITDPKKSYTEIIRDLQQEMQNNFDKKFVINFPLFIKEFSLRHWLDENGEDSDFTRELLKRSGNDENKAILEWVDSNGELQGIKGPNPTKIAQRYEKGFKRLRDFVQRHVKGRPVYIGGVGHSWDLDVFIAYMTHGRVDSQSIREIMGKDKKMIQETEPFYFSVKGDKIQGKYRGKEYQFDLKGGGSQSN